MLQVIDPNALALIDFSYKVHELDSEYNHYSKSTLLQ